MKLKRNLLFLMLMLIFMLSINFVSAEEKNEAAPVPSPTIGGADSSVKAVSGNAAVNLGNEDLKAAEKVLCVEPLDLDMKSALDLARKENPDIKVYEAKVKESTGRYNEVRSGLNFKFSLAGSYTRVDPISEVELKFGDDDPIKMKLGENNNYVGKVTLDKIITSFGRLEYYVSAAFMQIGVAQAMVDTTVQNVEYKVKETYYNYLKTEGIVKVALDNLKIATDQLKLTNEMFDAGVVPRYEVLRSELLLSKAKQSLVEAENARDLSKAALLNAIGINLATPVTVKPEEEMDFITVDLSEAEALAIKNRPEVKAALMSQDAVKFTIKGAQRGQWPVLAFSSTYKYQTVSGFSTDPLQWSNTLALSIPIGDGGETSAKVEQAKALLEQLNQQLVSLYHGVQLEVEQAVLTLRELAVRIEASKKDVETSREGYAIALTRYENGISTGLELDDSLRSFNSAKINYINLRYEYNIAVAKLEKATAISWKKESQNDKVDKK